MRKYILVSVELYVALVALQVALGGVLVALLLFRWPVVAAVVLAGLVSGLMLWGIVQVVTSAPKLPPLPTPKREPPATVDGVPFYDVEVLP